MTFRLNLQANLSTVTILSDMEDYPGAWDFNHFDIVDNRLPSDWVFCSLESFGLYRLCPQKFTGNFWDNFHDGDKAAEQAFNEVRKDLMDFHRFK
ncbi:hypothetical protein GN316_11930 [Xylophilus sp. Kf1]|nr:hypothetical protein [Xylophilus sp. Kf1]